MSEQTRSLIGPSLTLEIEVAGKDFTALIAAPFAIGRSVATRA